jgi:hypothetical protein
MVVYGVVLSKVAHELQPLLSSMLETPLFPKGLEFTVYWT